MSRGPEKAIFPTLEELSVSATAYGVLSHGLLSGSARAAGPSDHHYDLPWFRPENLEQNQKLVEKFGAIAREKNATRSQLAIVRLLAKGSRILPVVGVRRLAPELHETGDAP